MTAEAKSKLEAMGYDVDGALKRFVNNEIIFMTFLKKFPDDEHFAPILGNINNKEYDEAYKAAHAIKGVAGNLGLNPVFSSVEAMLQLIKRKDEESDFETKIMEAYNQFSADFNAAGEVIRSIN